MSEQENMQDVTPNMNEEKTSDVAQTTADTADVRNGELGEFRISRRSKHTASAKRPKKAKKHRTKKQKVLRALTIVLCVLLGLLLALLIGAFVLFKYYYGMLDYNELFSEDTWVSVDMDDADEGLEDIDPSLMATDEEKNVYLEQIEQVGSGNFELEIKKIGLSDVMMVVSICPSDKKIVLTSFLRDTYVMIPGYGGNRLNAAYSLGGPSLLVETIEKNFGLRIDRYATSNFFAFVEVADHIGKVNIYLNEKELSVINEHILWTNNILYKNNSKEVNKTKDRIVNKGAGYYELNGVQALAYARIRKLDNDFGRTNRQRIVMSALFDEVKKMSPMEWSGVLEKILPLITTNLSESDILKIMLNIGAYMKYDIETISVPSSDNYRYMQVGNRAVIGIDLNYTRNYIKEKIYG